MKSENKEHNTFTRTRVRKNNLLSEQDVIAMTPEEAYDSLASCMGNFMVCVNEVVDTLIRNCVPMIRQRKKHLFRHMCKKHILTAARAISDRCRIAMHKIPASSKDIYLSYVDTYNEYIAHDISKMHWSVRNHLTKDGANSSDAELYANIEVIRILLHMACDSYDALVHDAVRKSYANFNLCFEDYKPATERKAWEEACLILYKDLSFHADLNECKDLHLAYDILYKRFVNGCFLDESARDSLHENADSLSEDERRILDKIDEEECNG